MILTLTQILLSSFHAFLYQLQKHYVGPSSRLLQSRTLQQDAHFILTAKGERTCRALNRVIIPLQFFYATNSALGLVAYMGFYSH
jgi:hypothetical protein